MAARCTGSYVLQEFDLATLHDDHQVAAVQLQCLHWFNDMEIVPTIGRDAKL